MEMRRYLNLLAPLVKSDYTIFTPDFINCLKKEAVPRTDKKISLVVKSLFAKVPLDETISIILSKVCDEVKIETNIPRHVMEELLLLCIKHVHFPFNGDIYIHLDGVAMESPLRPLLAVFMCSLEKSILQYFRTASYIGKDKLMTHMHISSQTRYMTS